MLDETASISVVGRCNGVAPNLLYRLRRLMLEGGAVAVSEDDDVTSNRDVRQMEDRIHELERHWSEKPSKSRSSKKRSTSNAQKTDVACAVAAKGESVRPFVYD